MTVDQDKREPLTPQQALAQIGYIREIVDQTRMRIGDYYASFFLWGIALICGYAAMTLYYVDVPWFRVTSTHISIVWPAVILGAMVGQQFIPVRRQGRPGPTLARQLTLVSLLVVAVGLVVVPLYLRVNVFGLDGYITLWVGIAYVFAALFAGREMALIGGWIAAASIASRYIDPGAVRQIWLGISAGGGLLLTGVLFRRGALKNRIA